MGFYFKSKNKFGNRKTVIDGITFASAKEAKRYCDLKLMQRAGLISDLRIQPRFQLLPAFEHRGEKFRKMEYVGDFSYTENRSMRRTEGSWKGKTIVEDVKSDFTRKNPVYLLKKKLLLYNFPDILFFET